MANELTPNANFFEIIQRSTQLATTGNFGQSLDLLESPLTSVTDAEKLEVLTRAGLLAYQMGNFAKAHTHLYAPAPASWQIEDQVLAEVIRLELAARYDKESAPAIAENILRLIGQGGLKQELITSISSDMMQIAIRMKRQNKGGSKTKNDTVRPA